MAYCKIHDAYNGNGTCEHCNKRAQPTPDIYKIADRLSEIAVKWVSAGDKDWGEVKSLLTQLDVVNRR